MVLRPNTKRGVVTPVGPDAWYIRVPNEPAVVLHRNCLSETATAEDALLVGVLAWARDMDSHNVRLFGESCTLDLVERLNGRWSLTATRPCGEVRILESCTAIAIAEEMGYDGPLEGLAEWEIAF